MSFEEIMELQNKVGTKVYNEVAYGKETKQETTGRKKRLNKNRWGDFFCFLLVIMLTVIFKQCLFVYRQIRPIEVSAKKPVPYLRQVVTVRKTVSEESHSLRLRTESHVWP